MLALPLLGDELPQIRWGAKEIPELKVYAKRLLPCHSLTFVILSALLSLHG